MLVALVDGLETVSDAVRTSVMARIQDIVLENSAEFSDADSRAVADKLKVVCVNPRLPDPAFHAIPSQLQMLNCA